MFKKKTAKTPGTSKVDSTATPTTASTPKKKRSIKKVLISTLLVIFLGLPIVGGLLTALGHGMMWLIPHKPVVMYEITAVVDGDTVLMASDTEEVEIHLYGVYVDVEILESYIGSSWKLDYVGDIDDNICLFYDSEDELFQFQLLREGKASMTLGGMDGMYADFLNASMEYVPVEDAE